MNEKLRIASEREPERGKITGEILVRVKYPKMPGEEVYEPGWLTPVRDEKGERERGYRTEVTLISPRDMKRGER